MNELVATNVNEFLHEAEQNLHRCHAGIKSTFATLKENLPHVSTSRESN